MKNLFKLFLVVIAVLMPLAVWAGGRCGSVKSCDRRYDVKFINCYREGPNVKLSYEVTNNGPAVKQLKLWLAPAFTNFTAGGTVYNKDRGLVNSTLGTASGIGDLFVPLGAGQSVIVTHTIKVPASTHKFDKVNVRLFNYGTGDWQCANKDVHFTNVEWE